MAAGETVTVACRLPHGLVLRAYKEFTVHEPVMGVGTREVKVFRATGEQFIIKGFSHPQNGAPKALMEGGYALTPGVPKDLWEHWKSLHGNSMMVKNGLIFAHAKTENTQAEAKEKKDVKSNLERLDPEKLPKSIQKSDLMPKQQ